MSEEINDKELKTLDENEADVKKIAPQRKISLSTFVFSAIALVLAAVMTTYACCGAFYKKRLAEAKLESIVEGGSYEEYDALDLIAALFETYAFYDDVDDEKAIEYVLKAYVAATGDAHARYFTAEEYEEMMTSSEGAGEGIGVSVIPAAVSYGGDPMEAIEVVSVSPGSPAEDAGIMVGDLIMWINTDDGEVTVDELGYNGALAELKGEPGTKASFSLLRALDGVYEKKSFSVERKRVIYRSVTSKISEADASVGIVKITSFDTVTPVQFTEEMDALIDGGCDKFVFDVRYNRGGDLKSIRAVLSYFLEEGDVILSVVDKKGTRDEIKAMPITHPTERYQPCNVSDSDIGKYRDYDISVLCNGYSASAAELFVAALRDYGLADVVGEKTYGKGCAQDIIPLDMFGYSGALKLTTKLYYPPCGVGYDGEGITPDVEVSLSAEAKKYSIYKLPESLDDQLKAAIEALK